MEKIRALWRVLQLGQVVADPAKWKARQISVNALAGAIGALVALAHSFGLNVPLTDEQAFAIGGGVIALVNVLLTAATSDKIGVNGRTNADVARMEVAAANRASAEPNAGETDVDGRDSEMVPAQSQPGAGPGLGTVIHVERTDPFRDHGA